jgi:hypothetical protein
MNADVADPADQSQQEDPFACPARTASVPAVNQAGRRRKCMNYRREISHQKSPRRPDKFRLRLGLLLETSTSVLFFNGNRDALRLE